jgi:cytochrome c-type biogenesis protein CcmF
MVFVPIAAPLAFVVGLAVAVPWKRGDVRETLRMLRWPGLAALLAAAALPWLLHDRNTVGAAAGSALGVWTMLTAFHEIWRRVRARNNRIEGLLAVPRGVWGMSLAHFGLATFVLGVTFVSTFGAERDVRVAPGAGTALGPYSFTLGGVRQVHGANYDADVGIVAVEDRGRPVTTLYPEKRLYRAQQSVMTEAAVDKGLLRDIYVALGEPYDNGDWGLRLYYRPMMRLVWLGGVLAFLGGLLAATDRRYRLTRAAEAAAREAAATS